MRFDHMELTIPVGSLTTTLQKEIDDFYGSIFGWRGFDIDVAGRPCRLLHVRLGPIHPTSRKRAADALAGF